MADQKSPPSEMIRVPVALIPLVRQLSHRQGHTIHLLQGLGELVATFDSDIDINVVAGSKPVKSLSEKLEKLKSRLADRDKLVETKLEAMTKKLELIERSRPVGFLTSYRLTLLRGMLTLGKPIGHRLVLRQ